MVIIDHNNVVVINDQSASPWSRMTLSDMSDCIVHTVSNSISQHVTQIESRDDVTIG